jgi:hypothetical protein
MKTGVLSVIVLVAFCIGCQSKKEADRVQLELQDINLSRGEIALCGSGLFGRVDFGLSCKEQVQADFNLATALLHSFEYAEAEKVFAKVIDKDPECIMAYWGVAMSNFHPLWAPPNPEELQKGFKTISLARSLSTNSEREAEYIEAIATIFDGWKELDHKTRVEKFVKATEAIYTKYPDDKEAAVFYALALRSSADPTDKSFAKQKKAGEILSTMFSDAPDHPGIAHYLIHNFDYPELAELGLPAARKYAAIAANSAHAQHMPSHIFTRLGLWDESIQSNIKSMDAAKCYAENLGKAGHWDQELHGLDYLVYAYLQQANDDLAEQQVKYLAAIDSVFPLTFVNAYTFSAVPVRYALERNDWKQAASLELHPANFPWDKFLWQKAIHHYGKLLGAAHLNDLKNANLQLQELKQIQAALNANKKDYEANQVQIQIKSAEGWINFFSGNKGAALQSMIAAADMEDATEKHPVTPGEVLPARELLGDMYLALGDYTKAAEAYRMNLKNRPGRFNSIYGAALAAKKGGDNTNAKTYFEALLKLAPSENRSRPALKEAEDFLRSI